MQNVKFPFTISTATVTQVATNKHYPNVREISSVQDFSDAMKFDHVAGLFRNNERSNENFIEANCLIMDCDNDESNNPNDWLTPEKVSERVAGVELYISFSRNNMKDKKGKSPRPRFHIYFPLNRTITEGAEICRYKEAILRLFPEFDSGAKDAARFIFGVENPEIKHFDGDKDIISFLDALPVEQQQISITAPAPVKKVTQPAVSAPVRDSGEVIHEGSRNSELYERGIEIIVQYENVDEAKQAFWVECQKCKPMLSTTELAHIWQHILNSDMRKLAELARSIGDREKFIAEAKSKKFNEKYIYSVANKLLPMTDSEALKTIAIETLIKYRKKDTAEGVYHDHVDGNYDPELISQAWDEALTSAPVKLVKLARDFKDNWGAYQIVAEKVTTDKDLIKEIWQKLNEEKKSSGGGGKFNAKIPKKNVNIQDVEKALSEMGITIRLNVITQEVTVDGLDSLHKNSTYAKYISPKFHALPKFAKKQAARKAISGIVVPYLRDNNFQCYVSEIESYLEQIANTNRYNPLEEIFKSAQWDGADRISHLCRLMHIEHDKYYCMLLTKWLIQSVAMAVNDEGDFNNEFILTLYGKQGVGKTTLFRRLAMSQEWFCEGLDLNLRDKDSFMKTNKTWLVELGELDATLKHEQSSLKAFVTENFSTFRVWYGRNLEKQPKRCSLGATVNKVNFLKDIEGGTRRFGIIEVTNIEYEKLGELPREWYVQLWIQAYKLFSENHNAYRLTRDERNQQEEYNSNFTEFIRGEVDIREHLNWDADISTWRYITASVFLVKAELDKKFSAKDTREALYKIANRDQRIKVTKQGKGNVKFLLPPVWNNDNLKNNESDFYSFPDPEETEAKDYMINDEDLPPITEQTQQPEQDFPPEIQSVIKDSVNKLNFIYSTKEYKFTDNDKESLKQRLQSSPLSELTVNDDDSAVLKEILGTLNEKREKKNTDKQHDNEHIPF